MSVYTDSWSPYLLYAKWGKEFQKGNKEKDEGIEIFQDAVIPLEKKGKGFKIKLLAKENASLKKIKQLHVCASDTDNISYQNTPNFSHSYELAVPGLSQMALQDSRRDRLCSPTSTTAIVRYINKSSTLDPITFAEKSWDATFDIFGNWVFNSSESYHQLQNPNYSCWVERLDNFSPILDSLKKGFPVVISIRGPLKGSAQRYASGHLIAIIGYDHKTKEVLCMDPAFDRDEKTKVRYPLEDLLKAWERRKNVAYLFDYRKNVFADSGK